MKNLTILSIVFLIFTHCAFKRNEHQSYILNKANEEKAVLVLFPCFPCDKDNTKKEARFLEYIQERGVTTLLLGYNQKLFLFDKEKESLARSLDHIFDDNHLKREKVFFGGFSSGGNVTLLMANYLLKAQNPMSPKGVFVVDSPIDLERLYFNAKEDIVRNKDNEAVEEGQFIVKLLENKIGNPYQNKDKYRNFSPYLISEQSTENIIELKKIKTRFYCEPDLEWQSKFKNRNYENLNAYQLENLNDFLISLGSKKTEFIKTTNRGLRANGEIHPHSWNIVELENLLNWMLE